MISHLLTRAANVLAIAVTFGLLAGWTHSLELLVAHRVLNELVWFSRDFVWMSPIAYTIVLIPLALLLAVVAAFVHRPWVSRITVFACALVAFFGVLLPFSQIARIASLLLAAGAAFQVARTGPSPAFFRRAAAVGLVVVAVLALALPRWRDLESRRALAALPSANEPRTNVLFIILDTVRAASMGLYTAGDSTTPRLDQWARDGVVFDNAYAVAPWTLPSHASLFTGRYGGETPADWKTPLDRADSTLAEVFRARGYATAAFMANMHYTSWDSGLDRGFAVYRDYRRSWWQLLRSSSWTQTAIFDQLRNARSARDVFSAVLHPDLSIDIKHTFDRKLGNEVTTQFLDWQRTNPDRPFFAVLNYFDAHQPYFAPAQFQHFPRTGGTARYKAAIAYLDANIDAILGELRRRSILDRTLVIVTSDHGELFNEHGLSGHAHNLYRNVLHVPLVVRLPSVVPAGRRIATAVSLRDLAATIVDLAGARAPIPGSSLRQTWADSTAHVSLSFAEVSKAPNVDSTYPTAKGPMKALLDDSTHYIRNGDGSDQLFAFRADTSESIDVLRRNPAAALVWRARVDSILSARLAVRR